MTNTTSTASEEKGEDDDNNNDVLCCLQQQLKLKPHPPQPQPDNVDDVLLLHHQHDDPTAAAAATSDDDETVRTVESATTTANTSNRPNNNNNNKEAAEATAAATTNTASASSEVMASSTIATAAVDAADDDDDVDNNHHHEQLYDSNVHRAQFFTESAELFLVFNSQYRLVDANHTALKWFGKTFDTKHEIQMDVLCHPDHLARTYRAMADSMPHTNLVLHASGQYRWLSWRPINSHSGYFYAAGRDVTSEIEDRSNAESFVRLLCHEIRNPLLGIMGVCDVLQSQHPELDTLLTPPPDQAADDLAITNPPLHHVITNAKKLLSQRIESVDTLLNCCAQLNTVVNTTLNVSKLESGKSELRMAPYQPHAVLQTSGDVMMGLAMGRGVRLKVMSKADAIINNTTTSSNAQDNIGSNVDDIFQYYLGDQAWLSQVLVNLMSNAIKFTSEGGLVTADVHVVGRDEDRCETPPQPDDDDNNNDSAEAPPSPGSIKVGAPNMKQAEMEAFDKIVIFTVTDTGDGMTEQQSKELFQPFVKTGGGSSSDSSKSAAGVSTNYANCGLGLHISHSVVTRMGGTIEVSSELGKGTKIRVKIPTRVCDPPSVRVGQDDENSPSSQQQQQVARTNDGKEVTFPSMNIMVVDDVRLNRAIAIRRIREMGKHNITEACDGISCLQQITSMINDDNSTNSPPVDLIFMDVSMPGIDGLETTRRLRAGMTNSNSPDVHQPYIAGVSAFSSPEDRATALASGMDAYIVKPYSKFDFQIVLWEASARMME